MVRVDGREVGFLSVIIGAVHASSHQRSLGTWGVIDGFWDVAGNWRAAPPETVEAILDAMGAHPGEPPPPALITVRLDHPLPPLPARRLVLEDGGDVELVRGELPPDAPPGYHRLEPGDGPPIPIVVSPGRAPVPEKADWGISAQLYAARSTASWGIGDLADLRRLGSWSASLGAGVVLINPLHASAPTYPQQPSPYFAGSRCFLNPLYLAVEDIPGAGEVTEVVEAGAAGRELNRRRLIDRDRVWKLKSAALEAIFERFAGDDGFDSFVAERGDALQRFAVYCALAEAHGPMWQEWPPGLQDPDAAAVREYAASPEGSRRVRFHSWLQWLLDDQLERASQPAGVVQDLAVGVDPGGADAWMWRKVFAPGMRVGAPPDEFNTQGQDWALPAFDPWRLRSAGYGPWIAALRTGFRHGSGLRVDHVMGLFRLFWIPDGETPAAGAYVRAPHHDLLNILTLEAHRAGAFVVGEDLGTVEDWVRHDLAERNVMGYRVWWFEEEGPAAWPRLAMGSVTTHDLPTVAGVLSGSDLDAQRRLGLQPNEGASSALLHKLLDRTGSTPDTPVEEVVVRAYSDLAAAPCTLLAAALDDAMVVEERPNMPGTVDDWPNWSIGLPRPIDDLEAMPLARSIAEVLSQSRERQKP